MSTYTVVATEKTKDGQGTKGPYTVWKLGLRNGDGNEGVAELFCPAGTAPPAVGATVDGVIEPTDNPSWLPKLKINRPGGGGGYRGRPPEERRSIAMQASHKAAIDVLRLAADHGQYKPPSAGDVALQVKTIAQALFEQVQQAEAAS